ncbi:MAG: hypothetical protein FI707_08140 [SAR202 cluster bacterium]|jgi:hypothetical protein|nr:hypothetical protein [SAR202 cluster bacterium]MDP6663858.1 hypothetical protein [SAR202 cluster bacterium]MDP6799633.1 hypothetical protein [SAR202 cluster bacterium]MQG57646.1 hypothetical protein [SAR202 cluster bacterium]MQG68749.1 hypothetical protein [SAR202 cluster bacterium]|tara:strand:- start:3963 stop:4400 length:438 start_codon:yes stop_codon:yes gene_type:complete
MEGNFLFDIDEVIRNVEEAEVMSLFFPAFRKSLIIDTRSNSTDGPMVRLMAMANSPQDRARSIRRLRPGFPRLQNLVLIPWQRYVGSLEELGVWGRIVARIEASGDEDAVKACEAALEELRKIERDELVAAVSGKNYQTIWSARD